MESKKQTGFTLFPQPPTPPAKRSRARTTSSSASSGKLIKKRSSHRRKSSVNVPDASSQPGLIPAPLSIRRTAEEIPPMPKSIPIPPPTTPPRSKKTDTTLPQTPGNGPPQLPTICQAPPMSPLPRTPARFLRPKPRLVAEFVELEAIHKKRASSRLSQWLDLEDGEIDRRRLSRYLGSVLDNTFEVPNFESGSRTSIIANRRISRFELEALAENCECPPTAIICHCSSSPEFERFRSWSSHKTNASVSSTTCLVGVPRARFQATFFNIPENSISDVSSPPGLSMDEESTDSHDWSTPRTPCNDDVFGTHTARSYSSKCVIEPMSSINSSTPSKLQSFSRPFRPESTYRCLQSDDSAPSTPSRSQSRSTAPRTGGFLTSISTMSSFDFDFDMKSRRESLAVHKLLDFGFPTQPLDENEQSSHTRTDSNDSMSSQTSHIEVNTATASVALSSFNIKPVMITKSPKRVKLPTSLIRSQGPRSTSGSVDTSSSAMTIPDYWQQYDSGERARSRSTTVGSDASDESAAFSAMLTMPLLSPKIMPRVEEPVPRSPSTISTIQDIASTNTPMPGNAFAQRSNTIASQASFTRLPSPSPYRFDTPDSLSKFSASPSTTISAAQPQPQHASPIPDSPYNDHVHAYAAASARLRAFMSSATPPPTPTVADTPAGGEIGLGIETRQSSRKSKKKYLEIDNHVINRDDSGIFGRLSALAVPGRREFSAPQFYRATAA